MDKIERMKRRLGPDANQYNEAQLQGLSRELDAIAEFLLDRYLHKYSRETKKTRRFDSPGAGSVG